jgi:hypothetical protein
MEDIKWLKPIIIWVLNGVNILAIEEGENVFIPVEPLCHAMGIDYSDEADELCSDSLFRELIEHKAVYNENGNIVSCLPVESVFLWLLSIGHESTPEVIRYKRICASVIFSEYKRKILPNFFRERDKKKKKENKAAYPSCGY